MGKKKSDNDTDRETNDFQLAMFLIENCFHGWTPSKLLWSMEWWEILGMCEVISKKLERENEMIKNSSNNSYENNQTKKLDSWKRNDSKLTPEAQRTIDKIKKGLL